MISAAGSPPIRRVFDGGTPGDYLALSMTVVGLAAALLVAGRIVLTPARAQRRARRS